MFIPETVILNVMQEVCDMFLIPKFKELNMNASGEWLENLSVSANQTTGYINGRDYTYQLVNGRAPGKMPPIAPLEKWVGYKLGIFGSQAKSAAFAIAKKIADEGTDYYPQGTDLLEILSSKEVTDYVNIRIGGYLIGAAQLEITRMLKETYA